MGKRSLFFLLLSLSFSVWSLDFETKSGRKYTKAGIGNADLEGVEILLPTGVEKIPLEEVSDDLLNRLSVRRRERIQKLLEQKKKQPKEEKKKELSGKGESSSVEDVSGNAEPIARMAEQQLSGVRRWLTVFHITRNPPEEAKRFSALCEEFVREMDRSSTDRRKAEVFLAFQQKVREGNFSGTLHLQPSQGPMRSYLQNPESSTGTGLDKEIYLGPRGARYYKNRGQTVPVRRIK